MYFSLGSPLFIGLIVFLPCFFWCAQKSKMYYFPNLSWVTRQNPWFSWELWLKILLFILMIFALMKPFTFDAKNNQNKKGRDLILSLDASGSMAQRRFSEQDKSENRFDINIELASNFINKRHDDNMGIVIFGSFAYTASPLTYDLKSLSYLLGLINVGIAGESTAIGDAIMQSLHALSYGNAKNKAIILLTDGHHNSGNISPKIATEKAKSLGIKIYTIGIGKSSDYDADLLETIAKVSGAKSYSATSAASLSKIYKEINMLEPSPIRSENYLNQKLLIFYPLGIAFTLLLSWIFLQRKSVS